MITSKVILSIISLMFVLLPSSAIKVLDDKDSHDVEQFILSQLHSNILIILQEKYKQEIVQFDCAKITKIEKKTLPSGSPRLEEGKYFLVTIELIIFNGENNELAKITFDTDTIGSRVKFNKFEKNKVPDSYRCNHYYVRESN